MNAISIPTAILLLTVGTPGAPAMGQAVPCDDFYRELEAVPHTTLEQRVGEIESTWDGDVFEGCEISFETNDSLLAGAVAPDFWANPDTELFASGWRMIPEILADGAGSGIYGIRHGDTECLVRWEQPAYIDDDGSFVQSDTFTMLLQCKGPSTE